MNLSLFGKFLSLTPWVPVLKATGRNPTFKGLSKHLLLPANFSTDKEAILDILHNHYLLV